MDLRDSERRLFASALIGGEAGAMFGLLFFGGKLFVPLATALAGSALGPLAMAHRERVMQTLARRWIRVQLRRASVR